MCEEVAPLAVRGDARRLQQALLILLDNAVTYNRAGGVVEVTVRREGGQAALAARDTGPGIPADELPRLFDRFHHGRATASSAPGHGLGLAIARGIAAAHCGRLRVESTPGAGATFTLLLLPLASRRDNRPDRPAESQRASAGATRDEGIGHGQHE